MLDLDAFGSMIRSARERRGWRPIDLALAMGWSGTAPVYRIERPGVDTPRPHPDTVNLFAQVLELDYADRMTLLGFAGHLLDTEPLTPREEARIVGWARPIMDPSPDPSYLLDFRDRILAVNAAFLALGGWDAATVAAWRGREVTNLDLIWDPALGLRDRFGDVEALAEVVLVRFKLYNRLRRHEAWYRAYPACRDQVPGFVAAWERTERVLERPPEAWDLDPRVANAVFTLRLAGGERRTFASAVRLLHGGYGLIRVVGFQPG